MITQIPSGPIIQKYGGKPLLLLVMLGTGLYCLLPAAARITLGGSRSALMVALLALMGAPQHPARKFVLSLENPRSAMPRLRVSRLRYGHDRKSPAVSCSQIRARLSLKSVCDFWCAQGCFRGQCRPATDSSRPSGCQVRPQNPLKNRPKLPQKMAEVFSKPGRFLTKQNVGGGICAEGVERTWAMKFLGLSHTACPLLAASITPALANRFGWRAACYCYGLLNIGVGALPFPSTDFPPLSAVRFLCFAKGVWQLFEPESFEPEDCGCCGWQACCGSCWCRSTNSPPPGENSRPQACSEIGGLDLGFGKTPAS